MQNKTCWDVYIEETRCFGGQPTIQRFFVGQTFAVSANKAKQNVRFRNEGKVPNYYEDSHGDDWRSREYISVPHGTKIVHFEAKNNF